MHNNYGENRRGSNSVLGIKEGFTRVDIGAGSSRVDVPLIEKVRKEAFQIQGIFTGLRIWKNLTYWDFM